MYHVCHHPTLEKQLVEVYRYRDEKRWKTANEPLQPQIAANAVWGNTTADFGTDILGKISLVLTILKSSTYYWDEQDGLFDSPEHAKEMQKVWTSASETVLAELICRGTATLESLQSTVLQTTLIPNTGVVTTFLLLLTMLGHYAKSLGLHQVDSRMALAERKRRMEDGTGVDWVEVEIKRRIWWHIVSSDWYVSSWNGKVHVLTSPGSFLSWQGLNSGHTTITRSSLKSTNPPTATIPTSQLTEITQSLFTNRQK